MVAVNALEDAIPPIEQGREQFDPDDMPPPPDQFSLPPGALEEMAAETQPGAPTPAPAAQPQVDPATEAIAKAAASAVASKASLSARIQLLKVSSRVSASGLRSVR